MQTGNEVSKSDTELASLPGTQTSEGAPEELHMRKQWIQATLLEFYTWPGNEAKTEYHVCYPRWPVVAAIHHQTSPLPRSISGGH